MISLRAAPRPLSLFAALFLGVAGCGDDDGGPVIVTTTPTAVATATSTPTATPTATLDNPFLADRILNLAHRGGNRLAPEQTIPAWESALALGVDAIEMDFRATADGALVMMHDQTVERTTNGTGRVNELTFAQIRALDAGYRFTTDGGATYPFRGAGVQVPTLEEVLAHFPGVAMNIEIKAENPSSVIAPFVELLDRYDAGDRVLVASFSESLLNTFRLAAPDVLTSFTPLEVARFLVLAPEEEGTYVAPAMFLQVPPMAGALTVLSADLVERAHRLGLLVHAWDVDDRMAETIALGVDGLIVDDPEQLQQLLGRGD